MGNSISNSDKERCSSKTTPNKLTPRESVISRKLEMPREVELPSKLRTGNLIQRSGHMTPFMVSTRKALENRESSTSLNSVSQTKKSTHLQKLSMVEDTSLVLPVLIQRFAISVMLHQCHTAPSSNWNTPQQEPHRRNSSSND